MCQGRISLGKMVAFVMSALIPCQGQREEAGPTSPESPHTSQAWPHPLKQLLLNPG